LCERNKVRDKGRKRGGEKDREGREIHTEIVIPVSVLACVCARARARVYSPQLLVHAEEVDLHRRELPAPISKAHTRYEISYTFAHAHAIMHTHASTHARKYTGRG
jgi:hypothetical protein